MKGRCRRPLPRSPRLPLPARSGHTRAGHRDLGPILALPNPAPTGDLFVSFVRRLYVRDIHLTARQVHMHSRTIGSGKADEWGPRGQKMVETKTRAYDDRHLARVREQAAWLSRRRRRWCRRGAVPVVCLVRPPGIERVEREVLVVSIDRLIPVLRSGATGLGPSANELGMRGRIGQRRRLE